MEGCPSQRCNHGSLCSTKTEIVNDLTSDKAFKYTSTYGVTTQDLKAFGKEGRIAIPDFAMTAQTSKFRIPAHRKGDLQIPEITISIGGDWSINRIEQQYLAFSVNLDKGRQIKDTKGNDIYEIHQGMPDKAVTRLGDNKDLNWAESFPYLGELIGYGVEQILARRATLLGHMSVMHGTGGSPISFGRKKRTTHSTTLLQRRLKMNLASPWERWRTAKVMLRSTQWFITCLLAVSK